jgi:adenylate kinase
VFESLSRFPAIASSIDIKQEEPVKSVINLFFETWIRLAGLFHRDRLGARFIVLLGGPGAGKGTLAAKLAPKLGLPHLNMGNILRREIAEQTDIGRKWGPAIKAGQLVPDSVIHKLLKRELAKSMYNDGAVLDGIPRTAAQAKRLRRLLASLGNRIEAVVLLDVSREDLLERLALRRTCTNSSCARSYHLKFMPPKVENKCDVCGSALMQRDDEKPAAVETRF